MSKVGSSYPEDHYVAQWVQKADAEFGSMERVRTILGGPTVKLSDGRVLALPNFTPYVERGSKMMDETMPGWWRLIDTSALDLANENSCVLGQTWSHYQNANNLRGATYEDTNFRKFFTKIFGERYSTDERRSRETSAQHGFNITGADARKVNYQLGWRKTNEAWTRMWEHLTNTWLEEIRRRQEAVVLTEEVARTRYNEAIMSGMSHGAALLEVAKAATPV